MFARMLADLINVMWPDYIKNWSPIFLRNLPNADSYDTVLADQCPKNDSATPLDIPKVVCTAATTSAETQGKAPAPVPVGAIAGGVVGGVLAVAGVALTAFWIKRRKAAEAAAKAEEDMVGFVRMEDGDAPLPAGAEKVLERRGVVN